MAKSNTYSKVGKSGPVLPWKLRSVSQARQDIRSWKYALGLAENIEEPRNWRLQQLYKNITDDALLTSQKENRQQQVFSSEFALFKDNGEEHEEATRTIRQLSAYRPLCMAVLDSEFFDYSVIELALNRDEVPGKRISVTDIPRTNVVPQQGLFYPDYLEDSGRIKYRDMREYGTWILEFNKGDRGLLNKAVPHVLFKRFAASCWSELCEIYGIPPRVLKTNTQDSTMLSRGEQMMKDMGAAAYFIIDETETLDFAGGVATNGDVYNKLIRFCNNEISMLVSGAIISQDTEHGNRSKDETAQEMLWLLVQSDMRLLEEAWTNTILPALSRIGIVPPGLTFQFEKAEDTEQLFKFLMGIASNPKYHVPAEWIKEKFGIEVEEVKRKAEEEGADKNPTAAADPLAGFFD